MYLKEIVTSGFKSFADKIDIKLDNDITCIVGPNGSGKSNVVDAVRWVLGEQSVKSLRGSNSMQDVIFSGSKTRNPLNVASVELIFDNTDHYINIPYTEISIKRRIYRSGENEYFLNNEKCRLKDITDVLTDSSIGKESFNIISQGEVDRILSNSSSDRRTIIEEAAGVLKYKKRKEEALKKLDKTHINLDRVNDIITELSARLGPLQEQKEKASVYLENKEGLDKYEIALTTYDIDNLNYLLKNSKEKKESIEKEIINISSSNTKEEVEGMSKSNKITSFQNEYNNLQKELVRISSKVETLNGQKILLEEQRAHNKEDDELQERLRNIIDKKSKIQANIDVENTKIKNLSDERKSIDEKSNKLDNDLNNLKIESNNLNNDYKRLDRETINLTNKIDSLKREIEEGGELPRAVKEVLNTTSLNGIINTISNVIDIDEAYYKCLNVATSTNKNYIITTDDNAAKKAIKYLKDNNLGRATFFPLNVIKERTIDKETYSLIEKDPNVVGILSDLLSYNKKYENIIKNQFGNIIICKNLDSANNISHKINNKYRIITLEGDQINIGGSLTGGSLYQNRTLITIKQELNNYNDRLKMINEEKDSIQELIKKKDIEVAEKQEEVFTFFKEKAHINEEINEQNKKLERLMSSLKEEENNLSNLESISNNKIDEKETKLIEEYNETISEKEKIELNISKLSKEIFNLKDEIEKIEANNKEKNSKLKELEKENNKLELDINKYDIRIESLLEVLNEYEISYEKAALNYHLDIDPEEAREKIKKYKENIRKIGMVNLDSIEEFEEVNTRYTYLNQQREDLLNAENTLLEIMNDMDEVMKVEFKKTYENINIEFQKVFRDLFGGGKASLELTDKDNLLETGVDIIASPPGKKLTTISLLSGGEKTLTAISLLFAILNVKTVPFCLFDEVEAALDEANVEGFGNYLENYKGKTQFLIITHKKKTMEFAKTLYGITMQESGVSKLVSVNLEEHK